MKEYVQGVKDKKYRLMGFGHRVYKNMDPRASVMRQTCHEVLKELKLENDKLFALAMELERIALSDPYFIERKLYPNVDFYSGIVLRALGIPVNMFTVIFALARTMGWVSQWNEMMADCRTEDRPPAPACIGARPSAITCRWRSVEQSAVDHDVHDRWQICRKVRCCAAPTRHLSRSCTRNICVDPNSVPEEWRGYFDALPPLANGAHDVAAQPRSSVPFRPCRLLAISNVAATDAELERKQVYVLQLINAHRFLGVRVANLDPLNRFAKPLKLPNLIRLITVWPNPTWMPLSIPVRWWAARA